MIGRRNYIDAANERIDTFRRAWNEGRMGMATVRSTCADNQEFEDFASQAIPYYLPKGRYCQL